VACPDCRTQYDVDALKEKSFRCACGSEVDATPRPSVDAPVHRCGSCGALVNAQATDCGYCRAKIVRDPHRRSALCPECYAGNAEDARYCVACGVEFRPQAIPGAGPPPDCPDCARPLEPRVAGGAVIHECGSCAGIWASLDVFEDLVRRAMDLRRAAEAQGLPPAAPRAAGGNPMGDQVRYRRCPVCSELMARRNFRRVSGVIVDECREHGTWLDENELEQIAGFILTGGLERAAASEPSIDLAPARADRAKRDFTRILMDTRSPLGSGTSPTITFIGLIGRLLDTPRR
jgi:Zn-finger nucleic acid-binding protein